jgi:hypothetical protein
MHAPTQLIVDTGVAIIIVVTVVPALVVVCAQFLMQVVAWIGTALFVWVFGMLAVDATGLEVFVFVLGGNLPVVALVVAATAVVVEPVLLALAIVASIVQPVAPKLVGDMGYLTRILFFQLLA